MAKTANTAATVTTIATPVSAAPATNVARPHANANKYVAAPRAISTASVTYVLTAHGKAIAAKGGAMGGNAPTVMGCVAVAASALVAKGKPITGLNIVATMLTLPAVKVAIANSRAKAKYAANGQYCPAWLNGYVQGAARNNATGGLLAKA